MKNQSFWLRFCVLNFLVVAVLGFILRLNLVYTIPTLNQKFILEAHSHFAFYGWITQTIYFFTGKLVAEKFKRPSAHYHKLLIINTVSSYGMLFSFFIGGYFWLSIIFSSAALFTGFAYCWMIFRDSKNLNFSEIIWLRAGAFFAVISAVGIFGIAFSAHKPALVGLFRASTYFYLHYQYNGFFIFSCIGFFISKFNFSQKNSQKNNRIAFLLLFISCIFGYGLSVLWLELTAFIRISLFACSILQISGVYFLLKIFRQIQEISLPQKSIIRLFAAVFLLKILLQTVSCIPAFQRFIFGYRSAVIAYLHLVLLSGITVFLFWLLISVLPKIKYLEKINNILIISICLNQILLFWSCLANYFQTPIPFLPRTLLTVSIFIVLSAFSVLIILFKSKCKLSESF